MARIHIVLDDEICERLNQLLPYGTRSELIRRLLLVVANQIERDGAEIVGPLLSGRIEITAVQNLNVRESNHEN